jgi:hypothetical protein
MGNAIVKVRISKLLARTDEIVLIGHTVLLGVMLANRSLKAYVTYQNSYSI